MKLKDLFPKYSSSNSLISSIEIDSRLVKKGSIFFAMPGTVTNGEKFIDDALNKGASAVVCSYNYEKESPKIIKAHNVFDSLVEALQKFYFDLPSNILAVTGTNGKTSVTYFIYQLLEILGKKSAAIGTTGIRVSDVKIQNSLSEFSLTTPDIVSLYKNLSILKQKGIDDVAIEASSIGLEQKRMAGIRIKVGAFTNFTQDHLDYHGSMEKYFEGKMLLFSDVLQKNDIAVLNADIAEFEKIKEVCLENNLRIVPYSVKTQIQKNDVKIFDKKYEFRIGPEGDFQKANMLCALLSVISYYNLSEDEVKKLIQNLDKIKAAQGRMQLASTLKNNAKIFIDYAHTPDALENVLKTAHNITHNKVHVLFGCGGNRDKIKRPLMGKIASDLADFIVVTDDNPRLEDPAQIRKEILKSCDLSKTIEIDDRKKAIELAISRLQANDILIIAGKGHEKYQIIGNQKFDFDEEKIVKEIVNSDNSIIFSLSDNH